MRALVTLFVFLSATLAAFGQAAVSMVRDMPTIASLKALNVLSPQTTVNVKAYATPGDGGGGMFEFNPNATQVPDTGIRIQPNVGAGLWIRKVAGRDYIARWWGPDKTNQTLQAAIDWVSANGWGRVIADGGTWTLKCTGSDGILMKSGVTLLTADDSQLVAAANPTNNWGLIGFPFDVTDCGVGPARLIGWNLAPPGGDTNKAGVIFAMQDTHNVTIGGVRASNWYSQYADVGSGNENLQMFDENWQPGVRAFGAKGDGLTDDTKSAQDAERFFERYGGEFFWPPMTNGYLVSTIWITNGLPVQIKGNGTIIKQFYQNPDEGTLQRYSSFVTISAHNCSVEGFDLRQVGSSPPTETNIAVTGFFIPIVTHMATNVLIQNNVFNTPTGKGILFTGGSYGRILNNTFNDCGITYGNGHQPDWRFYEAAVPISVGSYSPRGMTIRGNVFNRGTPYKHVLFLSACDDFNVSENHFNNIDTPNNPLLIYSGDEGTTDQYGTNIYKISGRIVGNFISGTNLGTEAAIKITLATPTNYVPSTFNPDLMYSAITVSDNHVDGVGHGYNLTKANGTRISGGYVRVTGNTLRLYGNCEGIEINGGYYESAGLGVLNSSVVFGAAFLAPSNFKNVKFRGVTFVSGDASEHWMRNVAPEFVDGLSIESCDFTFLGAAGSADAPSIFQFTLCTNQVSLINNRFYITNSMSGRSLGILSGTNCDFTLINNQTIPLAEPINRRWPGITGRIISAHRNDMGALEVTASDQSILTANLFSYTNGIAPLSIASTRVASITGNRIRHDATSSQVAVTVFATNSTFANNIVEGNSGSDIVLCLGGKMYTHNNVILNSGVGFTFPSAMPGARISDDIYEAPLLVDQGDSTDWNMTLHRNGSINKFGLKMDNGNAEYHIITNTASYLGDHIFFVRQTNNVETEAFRIQANTPNVLHIGTAGVPARMKLNGEGTNVLLALDNFGYIRAVPAMANITYDGTTLTGGSGTVPTGTGFAHISGGVQDAAAKLVDTADINNLQVTSGKLASGIDATKIGGGGVTSSEFDFIGGLTSDAQTQLNTKITATSTDTLSGKTYDASASGNVLKFKSYLKFNYPRRVDGTGCTIPNTNDITLSTFMVPRFSGTTISNNNFCRFALRVPEDFDTSVVPTASLTVRFTAADTGAQIYNVGFANVANSAVSQATVGTWIKLDIAADASGANDDVASVNNVALTGWNSGLTAQQWWVIELNRAGAADASTVASELLELEIKYGASQ